jgi:hypothetical protein
MPESRSSWQRYIWKIGIPVFLGWAVARADFSSSWQSLGFVLAVVVILFAMNFPWTRLQHGNEGSESARKSLAGLILVLIVLAISGYEVIVLGRGDWFVEHALILLILLSGLILLLKSWVAGKASRERHRHDG